MTTCYCVDVLLQFPAMDYPWRINVSVRDLYVLDRHTERSIGPDGAVIYRLPKPRTADGIVGLFRRERAAMLA